MKRHLTEEQLIEHKFKLASDEQAAGAAEHLAGCAECRERLELLSQKFAALDLLREDETASEELISQAIAQAKRPASRRIVPFGKYHWIGTAAAVLIVGLALLIGNLDKPEATRPRLAGEQEQEGLAYYDRSASPAEAGEKQEVRLVAKDLPAAQDALLEDALVGRLATRSTPAPAITAVDSPVDNLGTDPRLQPDADKGYAFAPTRGRGPAPEKSDESTKLNSGQVRTPRLTQRMKVTGAEMPEAEMLAAGAVAGDLALAKIPEQAPFAPASAIELVTLPRRDSVQLTIYNSADLTLVREKRNLTLKQGWNWLQLMWANTLIDPTSLSLEPAAQASKIDVQQLVFPARLRELGRWLIRSEISGQVPFEITYFTSGLSWRAFYMGTLSQDEKKMRLQGYVRVANGSGEDYENAQTRLLVGKVNVLDKIADLAKRRYAYDRPGVGVDKDGDERLNEKFIDATFTSKYFFQVPDSELNVAFDVLDIKEIVKEGLSEYFLYTIEGTETIADKWGKRLPSFDIEDIDVESLYKYDEERWGNQAIRFVSFTNDDEHNLGETPIPDGTVKIFGNASEQGHLSYVGETYTKYIPVGEEVELELGASRLVKVEPKLMSFETDNYVFDSKGNVAGWDEKRTWQMEITNTRALPIEIEITRGFGTPYWTLQTEMPYEKHDATHVRVEIQLRPQSQQSLSYTATTYHGRRQDQVGQ